IAFCGTKSGRDFDKWKETGMTKVKAQAVDTVVVGGCAKYFECKVIAALPSDNIDLSAVEKWYPASENYPSGDRHTFYFGEIVREYQ
ncbi:MAG: flavin reductase family protein, partial [Clostridia bacterium]|nr:flavin reductase family protein [Clostridia bacterium]